MGYYIMGLSMLGWVALWLLQAERQTVACMMQGVALLVACLYQSIMACV
jgi:hypothetical protein